MSISGDAAVTSDASTTTGGSPLTGSTQGGNAFTNDAGINADVDAAADEGAETDTPVGDADDGEMLADAGTGVDPEPEMDAGSEDDADIDSPDQNEPVPPGCTTVEFSEPEQIPGLEQVQPAYGPSLSADGLTLYFAVIDHDREQIVRATREDLESPFGNFSSPFDASNSVWLAYALTGSYGTPFISADGLTLLFYADDERFSQAGRQLWQATRSTTDQAFRSATPLFELNTDDNEHLPRLADDGLTLLFSSNRGGGQGSSDLWSARRAAVDQEFANPEPLEALNTADFEASATLSPNGRLMFFVAARETGHGDKDIWYAVRSSTDKPFGETLNAEPLNSSGSEIDVQFTHDGRGVLFSSTRSGSRTLWYAELTCVP